MVPHSGGAPLRGSVEASGAKNSVTRLLVATLLTPQPCTLTRVPRIAEVDVVLGMLTELGQPVTGGVPRLTGVTDEFGTPAPAPGSSDP